MVLATSLLFPMSLEFGAMRQSTYVATQHEQLLKYVDRHTPRQLP